mmetsp:Transcript_19915/g.52870  ORF Transcript_19915/g.52870 Transcript_19915/m.52870 type:complete len:263 (+) Transcript_19915:649-1437(+)
MPHGRLRVPGRLPAAAVLVGHLRGGRRHILRRHHALRHPGALQPHRGAVRREHHREREEGRRPPWRDPRRRAHAHGQKVARDCEQVFRPGWQQPERGRDQPVGVGQGPVAPRDWLVERRPRGGDPARGGALGARHVQGLRADAEEQGGERSPDRAGHLLQQPQQPLRRAGRRRQRQPRHQRACFRPDEDAGRGREERRHRGSLGGALRPKDGEEHGAAVAEVPEVCRAGEGRPGAAGAKSSAGGRANGAAARVKLPRRTPVD